MQFSKHSSVPGGLAELRRAWLLGWWRAGCEWAIAGPVTRQSKSWPEIEINMIMLTMRMILWRRIHSNTTKIHGIIRQTWWIWRTSTNYHDWDAWTIASCSPRYCIFFALVCLQDTQDRVGGLPIRSLLNRATLLSMVLFVLNEWNCY